MKSVLSPLGVFVCLGLTIAVGCRTTKPDRVNPPTQQSQPQVAQVAYVDSDAFDLLLETALINSQPVIVVQTEHGKPEWSSRLNEWIAAWNAGRRTPSLR